MQIYSLSDIGRKRSSNQDFVATFVNKANATLALLADGMGGHKAGDVASKLTVEMLGSRWCETTFASPHEVEQWFTHQLQNINEEIYQKGQQEEKLFGMGTTIEAVAIFYGSFTLAHIGDSRAYVVRDGQMLQITEDHSLVNELVKSGELTVEEAKHHPRKNIITRTIGMPGVVQVDVTNQHIEADDILLLASDGLTDMVEDDEILSILEEKQSVKETAEKLIHRANENGGADNITVLLIKFSEEEKS
ncbi:protein phosphatase [Pilibacter termitis]|uniref:protein-serine/threonine phosphatase n=1 Tax=Pilibacter termitis TaxID=263852 RepID=A0A1T4PY34_9ENTE|nr:Stp1/IreP family PP2C-type Ser/Thr phosphatase [Pilibacter termitis]SJZ96161.1 protein phosphatase [Pilibacter termitis]